MADDHKYLNELDPVAVFQANDELYVARNQGTDPDREDRKTLFDVLQRDVLAGHTHVESEITDLDRIRWVTPYVIGNTYEKSDMVADGDWLMIANQQTTERAAPQASGPEEYVYTGESANLQETVKKITSGNRYTVGITRLITGYRVNIVTGNHYELFTVTDPLGAAVVKQVANFIADTTGWFEVAVSPVIIEAGLTFDALLVASEPAATPTTWTGDWNYITQNNPTVPLTGEVSHADKILDQLRVHKTDNIGGDRSAELLALTPGDVISALGVSWAISLVVDDGMYVSFTIAPAVSGIPDGVATLSFETVTPTPISYYNNFRWWLNEGLAGTIRGLYVEDGGLTEVVANDDAYGVDIKIQDLVASDHWDVASTGGSGGGGGTSEHGLGYHSDVIITNPSTFQTMAFNGSEWVNALQTLPSLGDVVITNPQAGDVLTYNGSNWINTQP